MANMYESKIKTLKESVSHDTKSLVKTFLMEWPNAPANFDHHLYSSNWQIVKLFDSTEWSRV